MNLFKKIFFLVLLIQTFSCTSMHTQKQAYTKFRKNLMENQ